MRIKSEIILFLLMGIFYMACKKPYNPKVTSQSSNYLVVEGSIVSGPDSTIIKLSRTVKLDSGSTLNPVLNAQVTVQDDNNASFPLKQVSNGLYASASINLDNARKYRLDIKTTDNREYLSDLVVVKNSPPIDSLAYEYTGSTENFYTYAHDPTNNTRYYRWDYSETYLYNSPIFANYIYKNGAVVMRTPDELTYTCYIRDSSSHIIVNSSAKLQQDIITKNPITQVAFNLDKLKIRYSMLVKQYALTPEAYDYYTNLAKNTEQLGSIFDAQPSEITGNIHCLTNSAEPVLGFVSAGTVAQKRIFLNRSQVPAVYVGTTDTCITAVFLWNTGKNNFFIPGSFINGLLIPLQPVKIDERGGTFTVSYTTPQCADCTLKGTTKQPPFWQN